MQETVTPDEWQEALGAAAELDLVHGGYFRVRPTGIQVFAGPDNAPPGWEHGFQDGSPELPRALVGEITVADWEAEDRVTLRLEVTNWAAVRSSLPDAGAALRGRPEDRDWLFAQWERLRSHSRGSLVE
jgi:hypothetical protein